jgi:uncharacterized protein (DUF1800 family)
MKVFVSFPVLPLFVGLLLAFSSQLSVAATSCPTAVSGANTATLTVDGVLLSRYASGVRGSALTAGIRSSPPLPTTVESSINAAKTALDVDDDGALTATDAIILARMMAGIKANEWTSGITFGANAKRTDANAIAQYVASGCSVITTADANRFLAQASFGAKNTADVDRVKSLGYAGWLDEQLNMPVQYSHLTRVKAVAATRTDQWQNRPGVWDVNDSMWIGMVDSNDQLRQRAMFALSQIFVVSLKDGAVYYLGNGLASYVDMLYAKGFGNFRDLLESVTKSTAMGSYLSHIYNQKENPAVGSVPDQNYAREIMQLFSIGLWELNTDGTRRLDGSGKPIPTYTQADVVGASRVLTGYTFDAATAANWNNYYGFWNYPDNASQERPMTVNPTYHSISEKRFLGVTIPARTSATAANSEADLDLFLDTLFNHPNVGPFIGRQLIQRLVTSNPSKEYVTRVANAFDNNGSGVRGDMKAVIRAILLDVEARSPDKITDPSFGKIREPVVRMAHAMRVLNATRNADPDTYGIGMWLYDKSKGLWQTPLGSGTVFNFYRPDFRPGNTDIARQGLVAPEMQITHTTSVDDIQWLFRDMLENGGIASCCSEAERNTFYLKFNYATLLPLVATPAALVDKLNEVFMAGQMSTDLRNNIIAEMNAEYRSSSPTSGMPRGSTQMKLARALYTLFLSPDYVVQK